MPKLPQMPEKHKAQIPEIELRDYFAAKALQGLISNPDSGHDMDILVYQSYKLANLMLIERMNDTQGL